MVTGHSHILKVIYDPELEFVTCQSRGGGACKAGNNSAPHPPNP